MKRWPQHNPNFWESIPFFRLLLPLAAGILCYDRAWLSSIPFYLALAAIFILFPAFVAAGFRKRLSEYNKIGVFVLLHLFVFLSGFVIAFLMMTGILRVGLGKIPASHMHTSSD